MQAALSMSFVVVNTHLLTGHLPGCERAPIAVTIERLSSRSGSVDKRCNRANTLLPVRALSPSPSCHKHKEKPSKACTLQDICFRACFKLYSLLCNAAVRTATAPKRCHATAQNPSADKVWHPSVCNTPCCVWYIGKGMQGGAQTDLAGKLPVLHCSSICSYVQKLLQP